MTESGGASGARGRQRADQLLVEQGLADSRSRARSLIMAGRVHAGGRRIDKPGTMLPADTALAVKGDDHPWVSRGGIKLAHAISRFGLAERIGSAVAIDVGASTGGFTDVLLHHGAARVYAVDVGYGQLADKLRRDPRVVVLERTNARHLDRGHVPEEVDVVVCDASFISLKTVLPAPLSLLKPGGLVVALIKPQFEAGPRHVGRGGVVRDPAVREAVVADIRSWFEAQGHRVLGIAESPIRGPKGNVEVLIAAEKGAGA
ncbi:MAG: TlyA family rRNA (cytidine-2'-O)-methyltransferase [Rhodothalassiaceae bacterium]|nr:MAG: TlyA family rRNA (cytidine-2'-O)-methyltransferase [Rhodothalassiaceae bacterium]